ncbi:condensation domain-containing protein [Roseimicrobium gellanilyticum]|nr:condensation domain-containing protein [Roseimicrobium gellanilyticum]
MATKEVTQSDIRDWLIEKVAETLKCSPEDIGLEEPFTSLGLDSLSMLMLTGDLAAWLGRDLQATLLLKHPTIEEVAELMARSEPGDLELQMPSPSRERPLPATLAQERLLRHANLPPGLDANLVNPRFVIRGALDLNALRGALAEMVRRHEMLRTTFGVHAGSYVQIVHPTGSVVVEEVDWTTDVALQSEDQMLTRARQMVMKPMDVGVLPLFHTSIIKVAEQDYRVMLVFHHLLCDADALRVFFAELTRLYSALCKGYPPALEPLEWQLADFAVWERDWLRRDAAPYQERLAWWREYWHAPPPIPRFPFVLKEPLSAVASSASTRHAFVALDIARQSELLARQSKCTLYTLFFAAFSSYLLGHIPEREVAIGTYVSDRKRMAAGGLLGMFVSMVPVRVKSPPDSTFREFVQRVRLELDQVSLRRELPFEEVTEHLRGAGKEVPEVLVLFQHMHLPGDALSLEGTQTTRWLEHGQRLETSGLSFSTVSARDELAVWVSFDGSLYDAAEVEGFLNGFVAYLGALMSEPDQKLTREKPVEVSGWDSLFGPG